MIEIDIKVAGDHWLNPQEVKQQLEQAGSNPIVVDLGAEGPSLQALGIQDTLLDHCQRYRITPDNMRIRAWSNPIESVPFLRWEDRAMRLSHFFWMSRDYWQPQVPCQHQYRLAMFMGRRTPARCAIMWDLHRDWGDRILFSRMCSSQDINWHPGPGINLESWESWIPDRAGFDDWWQQSAPTSLDGHSVADQYSPGHNTNLSLLSHYPKFDVEVVCETYTQGVTFFPTEKTVRPVMAGRPMLIYGPQDFLARMRDLGFRTWNDVWDEGYDRYQGHKRWQAMRDTIAEIMQDPSWPSTYQRTQQIQAHNRQVLESLIEEYAPR